MGKKKGPKKPVVAGGGAVLDRLLVPRIEQHAQNHSYTDPDEVADYLRKTYREYQRRQAGPFRVMVARAIAVVQRKGGPQKPELQLQSLEAQHLAAQSALGKQRKRGGGGGGGGVASAHKAAGQHGESGSSGDSSSGSGTEEDSEDGSDSAGQDGGGADQDDGASSSGSLSEVDRDSSDAELDAERSRGLIAPGGMNNSLMNMYARSATPSALGPSEGLDDDRAACANDGPGEPGKAQPAAFAPPDVVAAAAARALAREKAEREARRGAETPRAGSQRRIAAADDGPSCSGRSGESPQQLLQLPRPALMLTAAGVQPAPQQQHHQSAAPAQQAAGAGTAAPAAAPTTAATTPGPGQGTKRRLEGVGPPAGRGDDAAAPTGAKSAAKRARRTGAGGGGGGAGGGGGGGGGARGSAVTSAKPITYADLGGIEPVLADIKELIEYPLKHPEVYAWLGVEPPRGVLLHGPPGCGKTALANAIANECGVPFLRVSAPEIVSGMSGESEAKLRALFQEAMDVAPAILFIDEIDAIFPKRENAQREMERRIVAQMLTCMDDLASPTKDEEEEEQGGGDGAAGQQMLQGGEGGADRPRRIAQRPHVVVIGATNRPDALDTALRRAGRFDREIALGIPTEAGRVKILQVLARRLRLDGNFDFAYVAKRTPGFVGADLAALTKEAAAVAVTRIFRELAQQEQDEAGAAAAAAEPTAALDGPQPASLPVAAQAAPVEATADAAEASLPGGAGALVQQAAPAAAAAGSSGGTGGGAVVAFVSSRFGAGPLGPSELRGLAITMSDFEAALPKVQPSVRREGFTTTPDVTWDDVGSLTEVREELSFAITQPVRHPERFEALGLPAATGVLLYGPPGCGKTLVAKAVANESGANFMSIKGPELLNKYVGESERAVRQLFARARAAHPCVLFFDELDALAPRRGTDNNQAAERVVNQLLTEMDGMDSRTGVFIIAATNRPDMIDPALLRPGRLDKVLYVALPPPDGRASILVALTRRTPLGDGVDLQAVARDARCDGFSGADMAALVREAAVLALKECMAAGPDAPAPRVCARHFAWALDRVQPSVSRKDRKAYDALRLRLRSTRSHIQQDAEAVAAAAADGAALGTAASAPSPSGPAAADGGMDADAAVADGGGGASGLMDVEGVGAAGTARAGGERGEGVGEGAEDMEV